MPLLLFICYRMLLTSASLLLTTPWTVAHQAPLSSTISWSLLKSISFESVMLPNYLIFHRLLLLLPSIFPIIRVFSNKPALCIRQPKYWSFCFVIPFMDHSLVLAKGLCNSMKLCAMLCRATQDEWVIVKSFDKTWSNGEGNANPLPYSCLKSPMNEKWKKVSCLVVSDSLWPHGL